MFVPPGVSDDFAENSGLGFGYITEEYVRELILPRATDAHKGMYGHAILVCGSRGMAGAASLATGAALRSGCGLVTIHVPENERFPVEANFPSALFSLDKGNYFSELPEEMSKYTAVGVGCGLGQRPESVRALEELLDYCNNHGLPMVIDADALNILSIETGMQELIPPGAILTPHLGELKRLVGEWSSEEHKIELIRDLSARLGVIVVVKGANTSICLDGQSLVFNSTGNSGMAKGGSGDVLTGFMTGLIARGYEPYDAAVLGVYLHGAAGDKAGDYFGVEGMNSADMIDFLAEALKDME